MHPSGASGANYEAISGPAVQASNASNKFAFSRMRERWKAPENAEEPWAAPESLGPIHLVSLLCSTAAR
eukprot:2772348-Alexandrium_andersonii.AAC.1